MSEVSIEADGIDAFVVYNGVRIESAVTGGEGLRLGLHPVIA